MIDNVGLFDRIIRTLLGLALLALFFFDSNIKYGGLLGIILLFTAFTRYCPIYSLLHIKTCKVKH
ncbi:YgaP family membrane protein [Pseudalkalibacillus caeni]|uniref:DUF2892 domain-containing protein n=1 Tax=Exobacillus caeni TaxID=2574798 RepID=A0A5R9F1Q8_9BACL|nr:DUF2892 domain-containing protein [Pseudalkalibacillus caeni]TLS35378.1 DUF2892 domain-containing protein [Pseudalkalibacillus caeni]